MKRMVTLFGLLLLLSGCYNTGEVDITGYIIKMDGGGIVWRTMECKMMEGSLQSGHVSAEINVPPNLVKAFKEAQDGVKKVKVTYQHELFVAPWRGSSDLVASEIKVIE